MKRDEERQLEEKRILEKYSFFQANKPLSESLMCFGLEVGAGWLPMIDELCSKIQAHLDESKIENFEVLQVKEKFGGLRFYVRSADDFIFNLIREYEDRSYKTCEFCGKEAVQYNLKGWITTLCDEHYKELK